MRTRAYLVYYRARWSAQEFYWTGEILPSGKPQVSSDTALARGFTSAREAYEAAEAGAKAGGMRKLMWWRVGLRRINRAEVAA